MKIERIRLIEGPNVLYYRPVVIMDLDLEDLTERENTEIHGFTEQLLALLPGLREHHCAKGRPGGFVERLEEVGRRHDATAGAIAVAWTLRNPAVDGAIVGFRRPDQVDQIVVPATLGLSDQDVELIEPPA